MRVTTFSVEDHISIGTVSSGKICYFKSYGSVSHQVRTYVFGRIKTIQGHSADDTADSSAETNHVSKQAFEEAYCWQLTRRRD